MGKGSILVVDDTLESLKLITDILTAEGYQARPANSGELALSSIAANPPELILLDILMPGMDGFEVMRQLKSRNEGRGIPVVIFLSAVAEAERKVEGFKLGAVDYISKPFQREELLARVQTHLELARLRAQLQRQADGLRLANEQLQAAKITELTQAEELLRESKLRFRATFEQAAVGIAHVSPGGHWLDVNQKLCDIVGYTRAELLARRFHDITHPDDLEPGLGYMRQLMAGQIPYFSMEKRYFHKRGEVVWVNLTVAVVRNPGGDPDYFIAVVEDVSERKRVEGKLGESEKKYRQLTEQASEGIFVVDQNTRYLDVNPAGLEMVGYSIEELRGMTITGLMPPDEFKKAPSRFSEILSGKTVVSERKLRRKDGSLFMAEITAKLLPDGNVLATKRDITERKKYEEKLRESSETLESIFATTHVHVILLDAKFNFIRVNKAYADVCGFPPGYFIGKNHFGLYPSEELESKFLRVVQTGEPYTVYSRPFEWPDQPQLGVTYWDLAVYPVKGVSGEVEGLLFTLLEVTERVRAEKALVAAKEEAERANKAKSIFLSSMTHEIRTPLTAVMGFSQLLASDTEHPLTDSQKTLLGKVVESGNQLLGLVTNVLDLVKIESGDVKVSIEAVEMRSVAEITLTGLAQLANEYGVKLGSKPPSGNCYVMADIIRLSQVLAYLLSNAVQFNKKGGETTLSWKLFDENKIRISVTDEGVGISEENIKNLYKPFDRLGFEGLNIKGFGIGLTLAKRLVELMGGQVGVESQVGKGSTFYIDLPGGKAPQ